MALLLSQPFRGASIVRAVVYLPHLLGGVATIIIWSWLLNPRFGWINEAIRFVYVLIDPVVRLFSETGTSEWLLPGWLYSPFWCKPAVVIMHTWTMGGAMLVFLAALRRVPRTLYDAAGLDGAGAFARFRHITWPQITPVVLFNLIVGIVFTTQAFNEAYLLQNRGQRDGLLFYMVHVYQSAFEPPYRIGYASALCWIMFAVLCVIVGPLLWTSRRWVHYAIDE